MNKKEYALALKSAVAATADGEVVKERGHRFDEKVDRHYQYNYPYYTYMKEGDRIYDSLYLNYNKTRNIGDLNL